MIINPQEMLNNGHITGIHDPKKQIQPNGIDITLDRVFNIDHDNGFHISEYGKQMRGGSELLPTLDRRNNTEYWKIEKKTCYDGVSDVYVELPKGISGMLIVRSTFNRNGLFITAGLYDQGYCGSLGFVLHNNSGPAYITPGTRIGQVVFFDSDDSGKLYAGGYNTNPGQHWSEQQKESNNGNN